MRGWCGRWVNDALTHLTKQSHLCAWLPRQWRSTSTHLQHDLITFDQLNFANGVVCFHPEKNQHNYYQFVKGERWLDGKILQCHIRNEYVLPPFTPPSVTFWIPELYTDLCWNFVKVILAVCHNWRPSQQIYLILDSQPWKSSSSRQLYVCLIAGRWTEEMFEKLFLSLMYPPLSITHFRNFKKYIFEFSMTIAFIKLLYVMKTF